VVWLFLRPCFSWLSLVFPFLSPVLVLVGLRVD
jgi:hypothetical protein